MLRLYLRVAGLNEDDSDTPGPLVLGVRPDPDYSGSSYWLMIPMPSRARP